MKELEKEFVPYQIAIDMKSIGFDEPCFGFWIHDDEMLIIEESSKSISEHTSQAPLYQQAFRWFRKNKIRSNVQEYDINNYMYLIDDGINPDIEVLGYDTYEEAELECLKKLIEIAKTKELKL